MPQINAIRWTGNKLVLMDQTKLPLEMVNFECKTYMDVIFAIKEMIVRGAPAIGAAAAYGVCLAAFAIRMKSNLEFKAELENVCLEICNARPTAVNLMWAVDRQRKIFEGCDVNSKSYSETVCGKLLEEAHRILSDDISANKKMSAFGNEIVGKNYNILTHCNTGSLATGGYGTALGVIREAHHTGKNIFVYATETRPRLQGGRLTAWELYQEGIPSKLIVDSASATLIRDGKVDLVLVGADRIASNGDTANKIGTFMISVLAKTYGIPFYIVAPISTIDFEISDGSFIEIEERSKSEITHINGIRIIPDEIDCYNPAFDVTPSDNITGIITDKGILRPPYLKSICNIKGIV